MKKKRFSEEQIIGVLKEAEAGLPIIVQLNAGTSPSEDLEKNFQGCLQNWPSSVKRPRRASVFYPPIFDRQLKLGDSGHQFVAGELGKDVVLGGHRPMDRNPATSIPREAFADIGPSAHARHEPQSASNQVLIFCAIIRLR